MATVVQQLFKQPSRKYSDTLFSMTPSTASSSSDDIFSSSRSATTSATSLSSGSNPRQNWSKDVRWLVPPDSSSLINTLQLVDVDYPPTQSKSRHKRRHTDRMSALWEEEEDDDQPKHITRSRTISVPHPRTTTILSRSSSTSATVTLPTPLPVSSGITSSNGYTGLTLPRAAYNPSKHPARLSASVDITRSGIAQTTMSTIAITRRPHDSADTPPRLRASLPSPLTFAAHTPPPTKVHSAQVLVQVWAVALDGLDARLLDQRAGKTDGFGHIPGRSFVGRAIECGWNVNSVTKGDWVFGLTDVRKSGALAEFIVVDRRRIHRSPHPSPNLTLEQIALLPLAGVPAHRAVRTFSHLPRAARALVLHAHDGPGLLATQELAALGFRLTAQVPCPWGSPEERRARDAGARDVRCGNAVEIVNDIRGEDYDAVIDPLGGKDVWDACRRVLRTSGQFTTLVGDTHTAIPTANAHFKSNMRSLRRAFVKKDHKSIGYQWVSPAADVDPTGEDVRDSLAAITRMALDRVLVPYAGRPLPFERAPDAFQLDPTTGTSILSRGATAVVRILE